MDTPLDFITANDNEPTTKFPRGDAVGFRALLVDRQRQNLPPKSPNMVLELTSEIRHSHTSLALALVFWLMAITSCTWSFATGQSIGLRIFTSMAMIWTGLWSAYLAGSLHNPRLSELTVLSSLIGFICILVTGSTQLGLPLERSSGIGFFAITALLVAALTRSRIGLMSSISACLIWAALHFDGYLVPSKIILLIPVLIVAQIMLAMKMRTSVGVFSSVLSAYAWIGGFLLTLLDGNTLSLIHLCAVAALLGGAHLQLAKAAEDHGINGMALHILLAWGISISALIGLQHYGLMPNHDVWQDHAMSAPLVTAGWLAISAMILCGIVLAGLIRRYYGRITLPALGLLVFAYALIPILTYFIAPLNTLFSIQTGLPPHPALGMFLGGIVLANGIVFTANSIRRDRSLFAIFGLGVIAFEGNLAFGDASISLEQIILLFAGLLLGILLIAVIAKAQFDPNAPQKRLQSLGKT